MLSQFLGKLFGSKGPVQWGVFDCVHGSLQKIESLPFDITVDQNDERGAAVSEMCCLMEKLGDGSVQFSITAETIPFQIDGQTTGKLILKPNTDYPIILGPCLLLLRGEKDITAWSKKLNHQQWFVRTPGEKKPEGPYDFIALAEKYATAELDPSTLEGFIEGATEGFNLQTIIEIARQNHEDDEEEDSQPASAPAVKKQPVATTAPATGSVLPPLPTLNASSHTVKDAPSIFAKPPPLPLGLSKPAADSASAPASTTITLNLPKTPPLPSLSPLPSAAPAPAHLPKKQEEVVQINSETGELICPVCWLRFDRGDIMHIAVHESLRGDPILGEDSPQRFFATHFNERGQALDAMGVACTDIACPHCRRKLPYGFLEIPHHIFSIVGAPSAGKSYYLSVLIHVLQHTLFHHFGVVFKDSDPSGNALLNEMKNQLFGSDDPERAALIKTQLEGIMYERLPRFGRLVPLPKPFIFELTKGDGPHGKSSLVFYDNAGEHFEPGINTHESPGAQHVASSDGILFLFDPTANVAFRQKLIHSTDPQLNLKQRLDQQDIILAEMEIRIKNLKGLAPSDKVETPIAILVGKCDVWMELLRDKRLSYPIGPDGLSQAQIDYNSHLIRELLVNLCPSIVANAESISRNVRYFAVSALGHSPVKLGDGRLAPVPSKLAPLFVDIPILWLLSRLKPELISSIGR